MDEKDQNKQEQDKSTEKKEKLNIAEWIKAKSVEYSSEFKKIVWPSRKVLYKQTITVTVVSLIFGAIIFGMDTIYNLGLQLFAGLIG